MFFYSKTTKGFYTEEIHGSDIPEDAVEVSIEQHQSLMSGQANGKQISADQNGNPVLIDIIPDPEYIAEQEALKITKNSALSKLTALGLTSEEINALIGNR